MQLNDIRDLILSKDIRRKECGEPSGSTLSIESRGRSQYCSQNQIHGRSKSKGKDKNYKDIVCWNCEKKGHFSSQCKAPKKKKKNQSREDDSANSTSEDIADALVYCVDSPIES